MKFSGLFLSATRSLPLSIELIQLTPFRARQISGSPPPRRIKCTVVEVAVQFVLTSFQKVKTLEILETHADPVDHVGEKESSCGAFEFQIKMEKKKKTSRCSCVVVTMDVLQRHPGRTGSSDQRVFFCPT